MVMHRTEKQFSRQQCVNMPCSRVGVAIVSGMPFTAPRAGHNWAIEPGTGRTSAGVCIKCGKRKDFLNSSQYDGYNRKGPRYPRKDQDVEHTSDLL